MGLVQKETLVVFYVRVPRETERHQRKKWRTQTYLASDQPWITIEGGKVKSKHPLLYRREKDRLTTNATSQRPDLRLELKFLVYGEQDVEDRRVIFDILPCVVITSLEPDASMARIACIDMLMVRRNPARGRRVRVLKERLRFWQQKRSKVVFLTIQIQRSLSCGKLGRRDSTLQNSQDALGTKFKFGKERAISKRYPKRWTSWAKSLRVQVWGENAWGNLKSRRVCP